MLQNHRTGRIPVAEGAEGDPDDGGARQGSAEAGTIGAGGSRRSGSTWPRVPASTLQAALAALPLLAFVPVLYYSLTTPFGLIDDYREWQWIELLDSPRQFLEWCRRVFLEPLIHRYRPFMELAQAVTWKIFGAQPGLHYLERWAVHFGAVILFAAAFLHVVRGERTDGRSPAAPAPAGVGPLLPLVLLVHLWIFFPNVPAARLGPAEVYSVFFLGLCNWTFAVMLRSVIAARAGSGPGRSARRTYGLFLLGALGLSLSKETNVAPLLWILVAHWALLAAEPASRSSRLARGQPLVLIFFVTLSRVYAASRYHESTLGGDGFAANLLLILRELFLHDTSVVLSAAFAVLSAASLLAAAVRFFRFRRLPPTARGEVLFVLFLLGQFFSLYLMVALSPTVAPRYWYVLVPLLATLLAFGARFIFASLAGSPAALSRAAACALAVFVCFFIAVNYHNFLYQTAVQHSLRRAESELLATVTRLLRAGQRVSIRRKENPTVPHIEVIDLLDRHYRDWLPRFRDRNYVNVYSDTEGLQADDSPLLESDQARWVVSLYGTGGHGPFSLSYSRSGGLRVVDLYAEPPFVEAGMVTIVPTLVDYRLLSWAGTVSGFLQRGAPRVLRDAGVHSPGSMLNYGWVVHRAPYGKAEWMDRVLSPIIERAGEPVVRSHWDVYVEQSDAERPTRRAYLVKEACAPADTEASFYVGAYWGDYSEHGSYVAFNFGLWGVEADGRCAAAVELPEHAIRRLEFGQYEVWYEVVPFR